MLKLRQASMLKQQEHKDLLHQQQQVKLILLVLIFLFYSLFFLQMGRDSSKYFYFAYILIGVIITIYTISLIVRGKGVEKMAERLIVLMSDFGLTTHGLAR